MKSRLKVFFGYWRPLPIMWAVVSLINPVLMTCFLKRSPESLVRFFGATMLLPFALGMTLALIAARAIHQPAILLLPGARRFYHTGFGWTAVLFACGVIVVAKHTTEPSLPVHCVAGLAVMFLSAGFLWEPMHRWCGSVWLFIGVAAALVFAGFLTEEIRGIVQQSPGWFLAAGALSFYVAMRTVFARARVRVRATTLMAFCGGNMNALARQRLARGQQRGRDWSLGPIEQNETRWVKAFAHERFGATSRGRAWIILAALVAGWLLIGGAALVAYVYTTDRAITTELLAREFYSLVWCVGSERKAIPLVSFIACLICVIIFLILLTYPRTSALYPVSRRTLAKLGLRVAALRILDVTILTLAAAIGLSWLASVFAGERFVWRPSTLLALPAALMPFWPWMAGLAFPLVRYSGNPAGNAMTAAGLGCMAGAVVAATLAFWLSIFATSVLTWTGIACLLIASAPGWWWLVARARTFYVNSDLVVRAV